MLGMCKRPLQGEKHTRGSWFGPLGGSVLPSLVPLVSKQRGRRRLCAHPTDRGNQCTQVGHMGAVGSAFVVHPKRFSREFWEGAFAFVRRAVHLSAVFTTCSNIQPTCVSRDL